MSFFAPGQVERLQLDRMVFHLIDPDKPEVVHLEEALAAERRMFGAFFLGLVRSTNWGGAYVFETDSTTQAALARIASRPNTFQRQSELLATSFHSLHSSKKMLAGAFFLIILSDASENQQFFALIKYDNKEVLRYKLTDAGGGRKRASLAQLTQTFIQNADALQKSAIVRLTAAGGDLRVVDRRNPGKVAHYFEQFLGAVRQETDAKLTERLVRATRSAIVADAVSLPREVQANLTHRLRQAATARTTVAYDGHLGFLEVVVGSTVDPHGTLATAFQRELHRERLTGVPVLLDPEFVPEPRYRRLVTFRGIQIIVPIDIAERVVPVGDTIIIQDTIAQVNDAPNDGRR